MIGRYSTIEILQGLHNALQIKYLCLSILCWCVHLALPPSTQKDFIGDAIFSLVLCTCVPSAWASPRFRFPSALLRKPDCHLWQEVLSDKLGLVAPPIFPWHLYVV